MDGGAGIDRAGRIVGRDEDDGAGARTDELRRILGVGYGSRARAEVERHRRDALHAQPHVVIEVVRPGQDHLVAGLCQAHDRQAECLVATRRDPDFCRHDSIGVERRKVSGIGLAKGRQAEDWRIAVNARVQQQLAQMLPELQRRRVTWDGLAKVDQRPVCGKAAAENPALGLADGGRLDSCEPWIGRVDLGHAGLISQWPTHKRSTTGARRHQNALLECRLMPSMAAKAPSEGYRGNAD